MGWIALLLLMAACGGAADEDDPAARVEVEAFQLTRLPGGARIVTGKLHNRSAEPISSAQIQIALYDGDNRLVETMSVVVRAVKPGEHKPFRQPLDADESVQRARVRSVLMP